MNITENEIYEIQDELDSLLLDVTNLENRVKQYRDQAQSNSAEKRYLRKVSNKLIDVYNEFMSIIEIEY